MTARATPHASAERDPVHRWRLEQLTLAGYPARDAAELSARDDVDLHVAVRLLHDGCPVKTALRILR